LNPASVKELYDAPDDSMSAMEEAVEFLEMEHTLSINLKNDYHATIVRTTLTQNIGNLVPDLLDEMQLAFTDELVVSDGISLTNTLT
jgi:hypothetical protein